MSHFNRRIYRPSSELQRRAEEAENNVTRLDAWRRKRAAHTNTNIIRFPLYRNQYGAGRLPTPPESAA